MNRIAAKIPDPKIKFSKSISKFDYRMLMNLNYEFSVSSESPIVKSYDKWNSKQYLFTIEDNNHQKQEDVYMYQKIRQNILDECDKDINYIVNTLVAYLYTVRQSSQKKTLWACFGDVILQNLKINLKDKGIVCKICGKRFVPKSKGQRPLCCGENCSRALKNIRKAEKRNS